MYEVLYMDKDDNIIDDYRIANDNLLVIIDHVKTDLLSIGMVKKQEIIKSISIRLMSEDEL